MEITTHEASKLTGYSEGHLRRLARKRWVKARKVGGFWLFSRKVLLAYMDGWISIREAHESIGYSEGHLRRLAKNGRVKAEKVDGFWMLDRQSLMDYYH